MRILTTQARRRTAAAAAAGTALALALTGCGSTSPTGSSEEDSGSGEGWEYTDDRGQTISLDAPPENVVVQVNAAAALVDLGFEPTAVFGPRELGDGTPDPQAGDVDPETPSVGTEWGEFDMESYLALEPDLVITIMYGDALWYVPEESTEQIEAEAPILGVQLQDVPADEAVQKFTDLAEALGADVESEAVTSAQEEFEAAGAELSEAAEANPDVSVMAVNSSPDLMNVAKPGFYSDLSYFQSRGVNFVEVDGGEGPNWHELSWEQASTYEADLILADARPNSLPLDDLADIPTWAELPAVEADQVGAWHAETPMSHAKLAPVIRELAELIEGADPDVV
jgi:iron complex transport system substrate-binding protein